ncbi:hypothetical protein ABEV34_28230 [Methylorubrum rhodesianum]|jgi:hypothetical protein|uniref:hypothetical protein n=1 Tax=Methylorubrum TaxID=2282523 RepID=UPI0012FB09F9
MIRPSLIIMIILLVYFSAISVSISIENNYQNDVRNILSDAIIDIVSSERKMCAINSDWLQPDFSSEVYKKHIGRKGIILENGSVSSSLPRSSPEERNLLGSLPCNQNDANDYIKELIENIRGGQSRLEG